MEIFLRDKEVRNYFFFLIKIWFSNNFLYTKTYKSNFKGNYEQLYKNIKF